jgi:hypothetical protein
LFDSIDFQVRSKILLFDEEAASLNIYCGEGWLKLAQKNRPN